MAASTAAAAVVDGHAHALRGGLCQVELNADMVAQIPIAPEGQPEDIA